MSSWRLISMSGMAAAGVAIIGYQLQTDSGMQIFSWMMIWKAHLSAMLNQDISTAPGHSLFDLRAVDINGDVVPLSRYQGNVVLVINVASQCGFTDSSYRHLARLYLKYKNLGFEILAFPCNQFGSQEPESNHDIKKFIGADFGAEFPLFAKSDVNGEDANDVFKFLKRFHPGDVSWNFHGIWLVDRAGKPILRFETPDFQEIETQLRLIFSSVQHE